MSKHFYFKSKLHVFLGWRPWNILRPAKWLRHSKSLGGTHPWSIPHSNTFYEIHLSLKSSKDLEPSTRRLLGQNFWLFRLHKINWFSEVQLKVLPFLDQQFPRNIQQCKSCNHVLPILDCPGYKREGLLVTTRTFPKLNEPIRFVQSK